MSDTKDIAGQAAYVVRPKRVTLREAELATAEEAHDKLARKLDFPEYYGHNLDALEDCLGDIARPTRIVLVRDAQQHRDGIPPRQIAQSRAGPPSDQAARGAGAQSGLRRGRGLRFRAGIYPLPLSPCQEIKKSFPAVSP